MERFSATMRSCGRGGLRRRRQRRGVVEDASVRADGGLVAIVEHQHRAGADERDDQNAEHGGGDRQLARLGRGGLGDLDLLGVFQDRGALGQVTVERRLLVHAEEARVGFDVALGVDWRAEQARRHLLDGAQVADVDAGFAGDLFQREAGVLARGADLVADALVNDGSGGELSIGIGHDAEVRRGTARARLGFFLDGGRSWDGGYGRGRRIGCPGFVFACRGNCLIRWRIGVGIVLGHAAHVFVRHGKANPRRTALPP